ncbi:hypothetical protein LEP1GSC041_1786 [Leptospira noguchii str. 2006001870]|nr:hypothetical protein LEP1GSC041_1786 [Leptospira noguchii str. 2006001870]
MKTQISWIERFQSTPSKVRRRNDISYLNRSTRDWFQSTPSKVRRRNSYP